MCKPGFVALSELRRMLTQLADVVGKLSSVIAVIEQEVAEKEATAEQQANANEKVSGAPQKWILDFRVSVLCSPKCEMIKCTGAEMRLLNCLLENLGKPVSYTALYEAVKQEVQDNEYSSRVVASLIARIRAKALKAGFEVPIQTVRAIGYVFLKPSIS
ncbi:hypothetical protein GG851_22595 [Bordetella petrii]|nr:hypothetical protein [Bordetella petrii]